jgi:hypothetical protein
MLNTPPDAPSATIGRRLVMYLSGFDPQGPAHYHQLYSTEAAQQAKVGAYSVTVGKRRKAGEHLAWWDVKSQFDSAEVNTRYEFLRWDDIVRDHWPRGRWALLKRTLFASIAMWRNGVMWQSMKTSWPMFVAIALPGTLIFLLLLLLLSLLSAATALTQNQQPGLAVLGLLTGLPMLAGLGIVAERRTHMAWLMRSLACLVQQGRGKTPTLDNRLDEFAHHLAKQAASQQWDEILVVGHSSGAMMAMIVTARALKQLGPANPPISLLTLGHCTPLLSYQPEAHGFRAELHLLSQSPHLEWIDYGAPPDGCCFPLINPTNAPAQLSPAVPNRPKLLTPRVAQLFTPNTYQQVRGDKFRCHFQYLMATENQGSYDYFAITAGPLSLAQRHAGQASITGFKQFQRFGGPTW